MPLAPSNAIQRARKDLNRENASFPTDDDIIRWLSEGEEKLYSHVNAHVRRWHVEEYEFKRDSTTREYALPIDYDGYFLYLEDFSGSGEPDELRYIRRRRFNFNTGATPDYFTIYRDRILIDPQPSVTDSQATLRLGYQRVPERKHIGTAQMKSSKQLQMDSQPATGNARNYDSAYVNEKVRITAGTGKGQERKIVSFDAGNFKASVATKFNPAISTDSKYQILIDVHRADEQPVVDHAKRKMQNKDNMPDAVSRQDVRDGFDEAVQRLKSRGFGAWREKHRI